MNYVDTPKHIKIKDALENMQRYTSEEIQEQKNLVDSLEPSALGYQNQAALYAFMKNNPKYSLQEQDIFVDILTRKAVKYHYSNEQIDEQLKRLNANIKRIMISNSWGERYGSVHADCTGVMRSDKVLDLNSKYFNAQSDPRKSLIILAHEVGHGVFRDENGFSDMSQHNAWAINGDYEYILEDLIVERGANSLYNEIDESSPYMRQNTIKINQHDREASFQDMGYGSLQYAIDAIEAAYGVTEEEFMKSASLGRKNLIQLLASRANESEEDTKKFIKEIEINLIAYANMIIYPNPNRPLDLIERELAAITTPLDIAKACSDKMAQRLGRCSDEKGHNRFDYNKLKFVLNTALNSEVEDINYAEDRSDLTYEIIRDTINAPYIISSRDRELRESLKITRNMLLNEGEKSDNIEDFPEDTIDIRKNSEEYDKVFDTDFSTKRIRNMFNQLLLSNGFTYEELIKSGAITPDSNPKYTRIGDPQITDPERFAETESVSKGKNVAIEPLGFEVLYAIAQRQRNSKVGKMVTWLKDLLKSKEAPNR